MPIYNGNEWYPEQDEFASMVDYCKAKAIAAKFTPTEESVYRSYCREYSAFFHTPFDHVFSKLDPQMVILAVMEQHLEAADPMENMEELLDQLYSLSDPEYAKTKRDEIKSFIKEAEEEEELRQAEGRPIHKALAEEVSTKPPTGVLPKSGGINLSYLEKEENGSTNEEF